MAVIKKGREIISLPVIYHKTGELLGEVKDIYYDPIACEVRGFVVEEKGWFRGARLLPFKKVEKIDAQGVYIIAQEAIINLGEDKVLGRDFDHRMDIRGYSMFSASGEEVGTIGDLLVDTASAKIYGYEISNGLISDLLSGREAVLSQDINVEEGKVLVSEIRKGDLS